MISEICNNGHTAWNGYLTSNQFFPFLYADLSSGVTAPLGRADGPLFMNSSGDIVWDDVFSEAFYEAIPAPVPEPSSLFMLGTGIVGLMGAARRRRR